MCIVLNLWVSVLLGTTGCLPVWISILLETWHMWGLVWCVLGFLFQDTFCRSLCLHASFPAYFCVPSLNRWELLKTTVASKNSMQLSLTDVTETWWQTHLITALFLLEVRKKWATSNVLFPYESPSDPPEALLWVSITSSTPLSSPVDSYVNGKLWKRRSFIMFSKFLLK